MDSEFSFQFQAIGFVESCFKEKFGIPRQSGLAPQATAKVIMQPAYSDPAAFDGLTHCSHIWLQFVFHKSQQEMWKAKVKPPRLGGNKTLGVFATRAPNRPNNIGLSVVKLDQFYKQNNQIILEISGIDLLDGTPVLDIKPYVPYVDAIDTAINNIAPEAPAILKVNFCQEAAEFCRLFKNNNACDLHSLIEQILRQDPRPQYQDDNERVYGMTLLNLNVRWQYQTNGSKEAINVVEITYNVN